MFRFWTSESRGCDKTTTDTTPQQYTVPPPTNTGDYFSSHPHPYDATSAPLESASAASAHSSRFLKRGRSDESNVAMPPSPSTDLDMSSEEQIATCPPAKRLKTEPTEPAWPQAAFGAGYSIGDRDATTEEHRLGISPPSPPPSVSFNMADATMIEQVKDTIQHQFGLEILVKHNELRLIDQELAKCQIALEQLRRCHLIPYPVNCPTPTQMLDVASGRGVAVRPRPGAAVPKWAAPFGVVDGPYARHYARWLIPDPVFDGPLPNWPGVTPAARSRLSATAEARAARSSAYDASKGRPSRSLAGQKLHSLSSGYPQAKDKAGPCVLRRSDGKVVKLVCIDCHRENFSSTQGFINHCRIAHKRDFKSHEEAAIHCGHPIEADNTATPTAGSSKTDQAAPPSASPAVTTAAVGHVAPPASSTPASMPSQMPHVAVPAITSRVPGHVHPLARSESEVTDALLHGVNASFQSYSQAPTADAIPSAKSESTKSSRARASSTAKRSASGQRIAGSGRTPFLARFLEGKQLSGSLEACVQDATVTVDLDDSMWAEDETEGVADSADSTRASTRAPSTKKRAPSTTTRAPATTTRAPATTTRAPATTTQASATTTRVPTQPTQPASTLGTSTDGASEHRGPVARSSNSNGMRLSFDAASGPVSSMPFVKTEDLDGTPTLYGHEEMDVDMSPNPAASNNAPSLVSDDGDYDDSDDGSISETSNTELDTVSGVPEINMDEDEDQTHGASRGLRHHRGSVKLKKDEAKHVALVSAVRSADN